MVLAETGNKPQSYMYTSPAAKREHKAKHSYCYHGSINLPAMFRDSTDMYAGGLAMSCVNSMFRPSRHSSTTYIN